MDARWPEGKACAAASAMVNGAMSSDLALTMHFDPVSGIADLEQHLGRMKDAAAAEGMTFDRHGARNELQAATFRLREPRHIRLLLSPSGAIAIESRPAEQS
jgi:para-aminobenzoate synthetase/4-amino-4-deoxychorismate lyase